MKNHDKKDMNHNMFGEHSNGRRNPNLQPQHNTVQSAKEARLNKPSVHHPPLNPTQ